MTPIIDTPWKTTSFLTCLKDAGIQTIIRYYNFENSRSLPEKRIEPEEAAAIAAAGMTLAVVFQQKQNAAADFTFEEGQRAGQRAASYARDTIGQPAGSGLYFAVDYDASETEIAQSIQPYFEGVRAAFIEAGGGTPPWRIGAYGSGLVGSTLRQAGLIDLIWLSMSTGFRGTEEAKAAGAYDLSQIAPATSVCDLDVDYDERNPSRSDFGQFTPDAPAPSRQPAPPTPQSSGDRYQVIASSGLNVRSGPSTSYEIVGVLQYQQIVASLGVADGWMKVDANFDSQAEGYSNAEYLRAL